MAGPNSWYAGASHIQAGVCTTTINAKPLGLNVVCRRVLLVAKAGVAAVVRQEGQPNDGGFPIPCISADGSYTPLELWVNCLEILWVSGNGDVYWFVEEN